MATTKLEHALHYASLGIPVLPLHFIKPNGVCSCGGVEVNLKCKPGKHPVGRLVHHGLKDATTDPEKIRSWFTESPYNIGLCTGEASGLFALDRDDRDGGDISLRKLEAELGELPDTVKQMTGNGAHYLFRLPRGRNIRNSAKKLAPGLDIRGIDGYIVGAPSIHQNGRTYTWGSGGLLNWSKVSDAPEWLLALIEKNTSPAKPPSPRDRLTNLPRQSGFVWPEKIKDGEGREDFILRAAGHLRSKGLDQVVIESILFDYNRFHVVPPLDDDVVRDRARRYESDMPIQPVAVNDTSEWPEPEMLSETLPPVPLFHLVLLPKGIAAYVEDVAERMSCPVDFPAIAAVVTLSSAIGSRIHCKPYQNGTWLVPAGAWGMVVSPPSGIKSPPVSEMLQPLKDLDKRAAAQYTRDLEQYRIDKAIYDRAVKTAVNNGSNVVGQLPPTEPHMTRYLVNDSTYEMLIEIARANPNGYLVWRDELVGWFHSLSKENQKEARGLYLTGWSGTEGYATDRIGRGHVRADCVNLSLIGTIQPNVLRQVVHDAVAGGGGDDGLIQRFQFMVYPDPVKKFVKVDRQPNLAAMQHYRALIEKFAQFDPVSHGASITPDGIFYLPFDDEAQGIFDTWRQKLEDRLRAVDSEEHPAIIAHLGKYRSLFPKIALVMHLAAGKTGPIDGDAANRAVLWTMFLEKHARRCYHTATNRAMQSAVALANKIKAGSLKDGFTKSDVLVKEWASLRTAEEVAIALTVLIEMNWLCSVKDGNTGGRPAERYYCNPKVKRAA